MEFFAVFERAGVGVVAGLDVGVWVEDIDEEFFGRVFDDGLEVGADLIAEVVAAMAGDAELGVDFFSGDGVAGEF